MDVVNRPGIMKAMFAIFFCLFTRVYPRIPANFGVKKKMVVDNVKHKSVTWTQKKIIID